MLQRIQIILLLVFSLFVSVNARAQQADSAVGKLANPSRLFSRIQAKTASLDQQLTSQTQKYIQRMTRQEAQMQKQLTKVDSNGAKQLFAGSGQRYATLSQRLRQDTGSKSMLISGKYQPYTDSLRGTLAFLQQNPQLISAGSTTPVSTATSAASSVNAIPGASAIPGVSAIPGASAVQSMAKIPGIGSLTSAGATSAAAQANLQKAITQLQALQAKMQDAALIQQYMQQRQAQIQQYLSKYTQLPSGITNTFNGYKAQAAYYQQQVSAYQDILNDPGKMFQTALTVLNKVPAFSGFMQRHSALSGLMPEGSGPMTATDPTQPGQGLPGRTQVLAGLQSQLGKEGPTAESLAQKSTGSAMANQGAAGGGGLGQLGAIGSLFSGGGGSGSIGNGGSTGGTTSAGMGSPQLNPQKTQSFLHRLEFGVNLQSASSSYFFPATTDIGLSLGYKLNDKNRVGIGASYKIGWAGDIQHIQVSSQGASIRSFLDISIGGTWFASGGLEYNYQPPEYTLHMLRDLANWEPAGLVGISKVLSMKSGIVKNTKLQLLWNFLSYYQVPTTQAFIFRVGYSF